MANSTLRPKNVCNDCGDTWYPRGRNLSHKCPNCGSNNIRHSREALVGALIMAGVLGFSIISAEFKEAIKLPNQVTPVETVTLSNIESSEFEPIDSTEIVEAEQVEDANHSSAIQTQSNVSEESLTESSFVAGDRRELFYKWSESEKQLRDEYTKRLNDPNSTADELSDRKSEYLKFVDSKNQKCGDLTTKITSNINSDVSRFNFEESEITTMKCHIEENSTAILQGST